MQSFMCLILALVKFMVQDALTTGSKPVGQLICHCMFFHDSVPIVDYLMAPFVLLLILNAGSRKKKRKNVWAKRHLTEENLLSIVLSKTFFELVAIGTGISGIVYTVKETSSRALVMDALSVITATAAFMIGVQSLQFLKAHSLLRRAIMLAALGIILSVVIPAGYFDLH